MSLTSNDSTIATLISDFPNTATDAYQGLYQIRVKTSGVGQPPDATYDSADILVTGTPGPRSTRRSRSRPRPP